MDNLMNEFLQRIAESEKRAASFIEYKNDHDQLCANLASFNDILSPPVLVPVSSRVLMRGNLIHTNEVTVSLGCGYFIKCSTNTAQGIAKRRAMKAECYIKSLEEEQKFLEEQMNFTKDNVFNDSMAYQEIIEPFNEDAEKEWRKQHSLRMKENRKKECQEMVVIDHNEIMEKLELLEIKEEIEALNHSESNVIKLPLTNNIITKELDKKTDNTIPEVIIPENAEEFIIRKRLADLRQRLKTKCVTEEDIAQRLDELEEEEELEEKLDRLYDKLFGYLGESSENDDSQSQSEDEESITKIDSQESKSKIKAHISNKNDKTRRVSFLEDPVAETIYLKSPHEKDEIVKRYSGNEEKALSGCDVNRPDTLILNFSHSNVERTDTLNTDLNILESPSDIYKHFPACFKPELKPTIKNIHKVKEEVHKSICVTGDNEVDESRAVKSANREVTLGNIVEHLSENSSEINSDQMISEQPRPMSKFKSMRLARKKK